MQHSFKSGSQIWAPFHRGLRLIASFLCTRFAIELRLISIARLIANLCENRALVLDTCSAMWTAVVQIMNTIIMHARQFLHQHSIHNLLLREHTCTSVTYLLPTPYIRIPHKFCTSFLLSDVVILPFNQNKIPYNLWTRKIIIMKLSKMKQKKRWNKKIAIKTIVYQTNTQTLIITITAWKTNKIYNQVNIVYGIHLNKTFDFSFQISKHFEIMPDYFK